VALTEKKERFGMRRIISGIVHCRTIMHTITTMMEGRSRKRMNKCTKVLSSWSCACFLSLLLFQTGEEKHYFSFRRRLPTN